MGIIFSVIFTQDILAILGYLVGVIITMYLLFIVYGYMAELNEKLEHPSIFVVSNI